MNINISEYDEVVNLLYLQIHPLDFYTGNGFPHRCGNGYGMILEVILGSGLDNVGSIQP